MKSERAWNFNGSTANESTLKPLCQEVEKHVHLPSRRLCRYFATFEDSGLCDEIGKHYRSFYCPRSQTEGLPQYLMECFFRTDDEITGVNFGDLIAFDDLIYIRSTTCSDVTGCVLTYAHELQHFSQHGFWPRLLQVNNVLCKKLKKYDPSATEIDIPSEREANIVSKRVGEAVCGNEAVRVFAENQVRVMEELGEAAQATRWAFFRDVPSFTSYDPLKSTLSLVEKYKSTIGFGIDVDKTEWWVGSE